MVTIKSNYYYGNFYNDYDGAWGEINIILTHGDADGIVAGAQLAQYFELVHEPFIMVADLKVSKTRTDELLEIALKYIERDIKSLNTQDTIFVLDRPALTKECLNKLNKFVHYCAFDHHETNSQGHYDALRDGVWGIIDVDPDPTRSAAKRVNDYFKKLSEEIDKDIYNSHVPGYIFEAFEEYAQIVSNWDTFHWKTLTDCEQIEALEIQAGDKMYSMSDIYDMIEDKVGDKSKNVYMDLKPKFKICKEIFDSKLEEIYDFTCWYVNKNKDNVVKDIIFNGNPVRQLELYSIDVTYQSMLADKLFGDKKYKDIDMIVYINATGTISVRSRSKCPLKSNEFCNMIGTAAGYQGGGHPMAAGGQFEDSNTLKQAVLDKYHSVLDKVFK